MRCAIDVLAATLCATPVLVLIACAWWFFHERTPEPELTQLAITHINQQLERIRPCIPQADVEKAFEYLKKDPVMMVRIKKGKVKIVVHDPSLKHITYYMALEETLKKYSHHLKDNTFIWVIADTATSISLPSELRHVPLLLFSLDSKTTYNFIPLLNVDSFTLKKWPRLYESIRRNIVPYEKQELVLFWRGKSSDIFEDSDKTPRSLLVDWSMEHPKIINARFTKVFSKNEKENERLKKKYKECSSVGEVDHLRYRYQIVLDGVTATFPGFLWRLRSGCVPLKQDSSHRQWFYDWLEPHVHYIPIKSDLSDLMQYLDSHPDGHAVITNATNLVEAELTPSKVLGYFVGMLNALSEHVQPACPDHSCAP